MTAVQFKFLSLKHFCHFVNLVCWTHLLVEVRQVRGLWVEIVSREQSCWLHGYSEEDGHACDITYWDFTPMPLPGKRWHMQTWEISKETRSLMVLQCCAISGKWSHRLGRERIGPNLRKFAVCMQGDKAPQRREDNHEKQ